MIILRLIIQEQASEIKRLKQILDFKLSKLEPKASEAIVFQFGDEFPLDETHHFYEIIREKFPNNVTVGIPNTMLLKSLNKSALRSSITIIEEALNQLSEEGIC